MRNGFHFKLARTMALASLGWVVVPPGDAAVASTDATQQVERFLDGFWHQAWDATYTPGVSGMSLKDTGVEGRWVVQVHAGDDVLAAGEYDEQVRLPVHGLDQTGGMLELFVTAGLFAGATGVELAVVGLAQRLVVDAPGVSLVVDGFTPLGVFDGSDAALREATRVHMRLAGVLPVAAGGEPGYTPDDCWCTEILLNAMIACDFESIGCELACGAAAAAALAGCMAFGPLAGPCMVLVLAALSACIAACLAHWQACRLRAANDYMRCLESCLEQQQGPDPRITP